MNDFDECGPSAASMYLPGCAYYVAPSDFASKPSFLSQPSSCQMTFPYSSNLAPHVQPAAPSDRASGCAGPLGLGWQPPPADHGC
ncbi:homeobox protein Hox-A11-like protein [Cricetulus griseus]|nr:homeobox protein Hox-A11-like protein [Cricetulus griseus]